MRIFSRRAPNVRRLTRKGDLGGLVRALEHTDTVVDRRGQEWDLGARVRRDATEVLAEYDDPGVGPALVGRLSDENESVRLAAIRGLRGRQDDDVVRALVGGVGSWPSPEGDGSRSEALAALLEIGDPRTLELLAVTMVQRDDDRPLEHVDFSSLDAVLAMSDSHADGVVWRLIPPLGHARVEVSDRAEALLHWLGARSVDPLIAALERPDSRSRAAAMLGRLGDRRAVGPLVDMAFDRDRGVRVTVANALGQIREPTAAAVLLRASRDPSYEVRSAALGALDELGTAAVIVGIAQLRRQLGTAAPRRALESRQGENGATGRREDAPPGPVGGATEDPPLGASVPADPPGASAP